MVQLYVLTKKVIEVAVVVHLEPSPEMELAYENCLAFDLTEQGFMLSDISR